jgi:flagellar assembly factor FliW
VKVKTSRFGELQVNDKDIINFPEGLLGFENHKRFFVVDPGDATLILWLQSIDDEKVAFPIIEPKIFKPDYVAKLMPADMRSIELETITETRIYTILTIPSNVTEMSANLKAPIVINNAKKIAKQIVLQDSKLTVTHEMYKDLKKYIVAYSSDDAKRTNVNVNHGTADASANAQAKATNKNKNSEKINEA